MEGSIMHRADILRMARDVCETADPIIDDESDLAVFRIDELERFAALVAAAERETCAKVCIEIGATKGNSDDALDMADACADAIRARG